MPPAQQIRVRASDGFILHGSYWPNETPGHAALLLAHSMGADRHEWDPILARLAPSKLPLAVIAVDLRGHGKSAGPKGKRTWMTLSKASFKKLGSDMLATMRWLEKKPGAKPSAWVLGGSDLGATALVRALDKRKEGPCVAGVVLVSPGARLRGLDVYRPFRALIDKPVLLVAAKSDTISNDPVRILQKMGQHTSAQLVDGTFHGLRFVKTGPGVWDPLTDWLEQRIRQGCGRSDGESSAAAPSPSAPGSSRMVK